ALREDVAAQDAAEDVDQHRLHVLVRHQDLERVADLLGVGAAADVEEVGRLPSRQLDDVHRRHREAGAVDHAADVAVEVNVIEVELRGFDLERILFAEVAQLLDVGMPIQRVVVEVHLRVERQQIPGRGDDQRVDLEQRRVGGEIRVVERGDDLDELVDLRAVEADAEPELPRLEWHDADARLDVDLDDLLRRLFGDLFDVHAAGGAGHDHRLAGGAIEHDAQVEFARHLQPFLDQHARDE